MHSEIAESLVYPLSYVCNAVKDLKELHLSLEKLSWGFIFWESESRMVNE